METYRQRYDNTADTLATVRLHLFHIVDDIVKAVDYIVNDMRAYISLTISYDMTTYRRRHVDRTHDMTMSRDMEAYR